MVLLPTGAGKSIIYQLAGLLMPGLTLVVDPINALIEDQVEGLHAYGIDRAVPITGDIDRVERERLLWRVERGEYLFVLHSPERLQSPQFRSALRALAESSLVNLAVIDEAHCVSEWGHDFRPAYLNLGNNLRRFGAGGAQSPPPLLALTGTASRAVLRDMLTDLGIDRGRSEALVRPHSFDRPELHFEIAHTSPKEDPRAALRGVLNALPGKLGLPRTEFFRPAGRDTASGIVFVPTVTARTYSVRDARGIVQNATGSEVTVYSGSSPSRDSRDRSGSWNEEKRRNASAFKTNRVPVLVATKAFGMGIDKPNIRYTVHFGMPMSLESFYQEAGRAGRDGEISARRSPSRCWTLPTEDLTALFSGRQPPVAPISSTTLAYAPSWPRDEFGTSSTAWNAWRDAWFGSTGRARYRRRWEPDMNMMDEVLERLNETERRAGEVVSHLEQLEPIQRSLADTEQGLKKTNANVQSVADATRKAVEALKETLIAFRDAIEMIRRSDPAAVRESLARIEAEVGRIGAKLAVVDDLASELKDVRRTVVRTAESSDRETKRLIEDAVERLSSQTVADRIFGRYRST